MADFGNDLFSFRIIDREKKIKNELTESFLSETIKPVQTHYKQPIKKKITTVLQQSAILYNTIISDNEDAVEKQIQGDDPFYLDLSLTSIQLPLKLL